MAVRGGGGPLIRMEIMAKPVVKYYINQNMLMIQDPEY